MNTLWKKYHFALLLCVTAYLIKCGNNNQPSRLPASVKQSIAGKKPISTANLFGDSIRGLFVGGDSIEWQIKTFGNHAWIYIKDVDRWKFDTTIYGDLDARCDVYCPIEIRQRKELLKRFFFPRKKVSAEWLNKLSAFQHKAPPDTLWNLVFPGISVKDIKFIKIYSKNLDNDPELEKIVWSERNGLSTCNNTTIFFDKTVPGWSIVGMVGPCFISDNPVFLKNKPFVLIPIPLNTSDHNSMTNHFFKMVDGKMKCVLSVYEEEDMFRNGPGDYWESLHSRLKMVHEKKIGIKYYYRSYQKIGVGQKNKFDTRKSKLDAQKSKYVLYTWGDERKAFYPANNAPESIYGFRKY